MNLIYKPNLRRTPRVRLFIEFAVALLREHAAAFEDGLPRSLAERPHRHRYGYRRASSVLRSRLQRHCHQGPCRASKPMYW